MDGLQLTVVHSLFGWNRIRISQTKASVLLALAFVIGELRLCFVKLEFLFLALASVSGANSIRSY